MSMFRKWLLCLLPVLGLTIVPFCDVRLLAQQAETVTTPPDGDTEAAAAKTETVRNHQAALLILKPDWSLVKDAPRISAEIKAALKDQVAPEILDQKSPSHAADLWFPANRVTYFEPQEFSQFLSWLRAHDLIVRQQIFDEPKSKLRKGTWPIDAVNLDLISTLKLTGQEIPIPPYNERNDAPPLVKRDAMWVLESRWQRPDDNVVLNRACLLSDSYRDQVIPISTLDLAFFQIVLDKRSVAVMRLFPMSTDAQPIELCEQQQLLPLIVFFDTRAIPAGLPGGQRIEDVMPRPGLPERFVPLRINGTGGDGWAKEVELPAGAMPPSAGLIKQPTAAAAERAADSVLRIYALQNIQSQAAEELLSQVYSDPIKDKRLSIAEDARTNSLVVKSDAGLQDEIAALLMRLDEVSAKPAPPAPSIDDLPSSAELRRRYRAAEKTAAELAFQCRGPHPDPATGTRVRQQLDSKIAEAFDLRQQLQRSELAELRHKIESIESTIAARDRVKQEIIQRRAEELLNPQLRWNPGQSGTTNKSRGQMTSAAQPTAAHFAPDTYSLDLCVYQAGTKEVMQALQLKNISQEPRALSFIHRDSDGTSRLRESQNWKVLARPKVAVLNGNTSIVEISGLAKISETTGETAVPQTWKTRLTLMPQRKSDTELEVKFQMAFGKAPETPGVNPSDSSQAKPVELTIPVHLQDDTFVGPFIYSAEETPLWVLLSVRDHTPVQR